MKTVKAFYEIIDQPANLTEAKKIGEFAGRFCYHSVANITEDSYIKYLDNLIEKHHYSPLEHIPIYLKFEDTHHEFASDINWINYNRSEFYRKNHYSRCVDIGGHSYVTTTYRILVENDRLSDISYWSGITPYHIPRVSVHIYSNIQAYKELTRHRKMSYAIESTRFNNYTNAKKFSGMTFIEPCWLTDEDRPTIDWTKVTCLHQEFPSTDLTNFGAVWFEQPMEEVEVNASKEHQLMSRWTAGDVLYHCLKVQEDTYNLLIKMGWSPQQAAACLPQDLGAHIMMTGYADDWMFVFGLRSKLARTGDPHPTVEDVSTPLLKEFIQKDYIALDDELRDEMKEKGIL